MNFPDDDALTAGEAALDPALLAHTWPEDFRAGFVAVVGRPNAGKSTLTNALVGAKVAITSGRPETTRHTVRGVVHREDAQLVLVDTPGLHRPRTLLGERLNEMVHEALADVDAVVVCLPLPVEAPISPVLISLLPNNLLISDDLPTPDEPRKQ